MIDLPPTCMACHDEQALPNARGLGKVCRDLWHASPAFKAAYQLGEEALEEAFEAFLPELRAVAKELRR